MRFVTVYKIIWKSVRQELLTVRTYLQGFNIRKVSDRGLDSRDLVHGLYRKVLYKTEFLIVWT